MNEFRPADVGRELAGNGGLAVITGYTDDQHVTITVTEAFPSVNLNAGEWVILGSPMTTCTPSGTTAGAVISLTLAAGGWRPSDVGSFVRINGGICRITSYTSATAVNAEVIAALTSTVAAQALAWTLEDSMWGGVYGYPRCGVLYQQRLWLGGAPGFPMSLWGSVIGEFLDFTLGDLDTDAISYNVATGENNPIVALAASDVLVIMTTGGELTAFGGQEKPITPTNLQIRDQSVFGSNPRVAPLRVGGQLFMVQRSGKKMRALSANPYSDAKYVAPDISVLAEHITSPGIVASAYRAEPDSVVFAVRADGQLATLTADQDQDVFAWTRQVTQGNYEDVETVPVADGWATYVIVSRVIEGQAVRFIEKFDATLHTDSALTGTSPSGTATWTGFDHLEGMTMQVKADGVYQGAFTVQDGEITLTRDAFAIEGGLAYNSTILTLTPELSVPVNPLQDAQVSAHRIKVRLHETIGCTINLQEVAFRRLGRGVLDQPPQPFTGDKSAGGLGWGDGALRQLIQQTLPYPFHCLAVMQSLTVNEG